ncbi:dioxygenase [Alkalilacustris brevis]|uniref:dioxygenase family protein n=1 Tax=Alkalilacustris brevis TaxID=2026338 RepID=UPI000E0D7D75|nr:dioxygenase [Alkalilacustris brevis]
MRTVTQDTITEAFLATCSKEVDPRLRFILEQLANHLHQFAIKTGLTHEEWRKGISLLRKAGEISDDERDEFVLLSDVLGLSSLIDMINSAPDGTSSSVLGPFHILGAPALPVGGDLKRDNEGATVVIAGQVRDADGNPVRGAAMEIWQTADNGLYSNQDPTQPDYNLRARMTLGDDGRYALTTVRPAPYTVPTDGPVGELLHGMGRHPWRPSHLHFIITAPGYRSLVTELFPDDDPYLDEDAVFGVREDLIMEYREQKPGDPLPEGLEAADRLTDPYYRVDFDFVLVPEG